MSVSSYVSHCVKATLGENLYVEQTGFLGNKMYWRKFSMKLMLVSNSSGCQRKLKYFLTVYSTPR